jgi:cysteine-rich repeat protein
MERVMRTLAWVTAGAIIWIAACEASTLGVEGGGAGGGGEEDSGSGEDSSAPACGDGRVDPGEACDDADGDDADDCTNTCTLARCGDGVLGPGEGCDDGDGDDEDDCTNTCTPARCGDGVLGPGEGCDDGDGDDGDECTNACALARCGDGVLGPGEACDDGDGDNSDGCTDACALPRCGDGHLQAGEVCDDGNDVDTDACTSACAAAACGDTLVGPGEACDDGATNGDYGHCAADCGGPGPRCGDGTLQALLEACDDGNAVDSDRCSNLCIRAQYAFVTQQSYLGDFGGALQADSICTQNAADVGLGDPGSHWVAWVSDATSAPLDRMNTAFAGNYVLTTHETIAVGWTGLTGDALLHAIDRDADKQTILTLSAWTNTGPNAKAVDPSGVQACNNWTSPMAGTGLYGRTDKSDEGWTKYGNAGCNAPMHLYCFEDLQ